MTLDARVIEQHLQAGGLRADEAAFLARLGELTEATSQDLQSALALPQPRVSRLARRLEDAGWVRVGVAKHFAAGRPAHVYRLMRPLPAIAEELRRRAERTRIERAPGLRAGTRPLRRTTPS